MAAQAHAPKPVVVVDDDPDVRDALCEFLRDEGYPVVGAENGKRALDVLHEVGDAGMVMTDMMMPEMDGAALIETLKDDPQLANVPVVLVSARLKPDQQIPGVDRVMHKPFDLDDVLQTVRKLYRS